MIMIWGITMTTSKEFKVSIRDFQIIKKASLTFTPGLNCIIGQSNNGKSAILRAIKSAIYNKAGTTSVRNGASSYAVGLQNDEHTVILQKGANSCYKVDGVLLSKIGRVQIPEVAKALGINSLTLNGNTEEINFLDQMEKPFLLDRSETDLFRFIVDSGKDNNVTLALKTLTQDRQQITRDIANTQGRLEQVESDLKIQEANLKDSDAKLELFRSVIDLGPRITRSKELSLLREALNSQYERLNILNTKDNSLKTIIESVEASSDEVSSNIKKVNVLEQIIGSLNKSNLDKTKLEDYLTKLKLVDDTKLVEDFNKYNLMEELLSKYRESKVLLEKVKSIPDIKTNVGDKVKELNEINTLILNITKLNNELSSYENSLNSIKVELDSLSKEINSLGVCPMCGKPLQV